jgi:hypothetical protein
MKTTLTLAIISSMMLVGCTPPVATLDLIAQGSKALDMAAAAQVSDAQEVMEGNTAKSKLLDAQFDADVQNCAAGKIIGADGKPVAFSAQWVIDARKGYAIGKATIAADTMNLKETVATRLDNISAGKDALNMASKIIILQQNLGDNMTGWMITAQDKASKLSLSSLNKPAPAAPK